MSPGAPGEAPKQMAIFELLDYIVNEVSDGEFFDPLCVPPSVHAVI